MILKINSFGKGNRDQKLKKCANKLEIKIAYGSKLKMEFNGCCRMKVNFKAFAIPILTAIVKHYKGKCTQNRNSKCFRINLHSI